MESLIANTYSPYLGTLYMISGSGLKEKRSL